MSEYDFAFVKILEAGFYTKALAYIPILLIKLSLIFTFDLEPSDFAKAVFPKENNKGSKTNFINHLFLLVRFHSGSLMKNNVRFQLSFCPQHREYVFLEKLFSLTFQNR